MPGTTNNLSLGIAKDRGEFDFIVVGGGTAGNAVAGRLAENPKVTVAVVEAGTGHTREVGAIMTPGRAFELRGSEHDWGFKGTMVDRPDYTRVEKPITRGKALGGSSCGNYYTWLRGSKGTYDDWAEFGGDLWKWEQCKEYFDKPATYHDDNDQFDPGLKKVGTSGPLDISVSDLVPELQPFREALTKAWTSKGGELNDNVYEGRQFGLVKNINTIYDGLRSTSTCFLDDKPNITVLAEMNVTKINLQDGTATGISATNFKGETISLKARKEVILSAGAFQSPQLLMLSGIGPKAHLSNLSIPCQVDSPHVGQNLLDHPIMPHVFKLKKGMGMDHQLLYPNAKKEAAVAAYHKSRSGPLRSGLLELLAFPRIDERLEKYPQYRAAKAANGGKDPFGPDGQPHFEIDFVPMFSKPFQWNFPPPQDSESDYLTVIVDLLRPVSKPGSITLHSANPSAPPVINQNFCNDDLDVLALREGVRYIDDVLMNGEGMKDMIGEDYPWPMPRDSDAAMDRMVLERLQTGFHPCGTCRLGKEGVEQGVVDERLRVHGVKGLRVIDASVFPVIPDCRIQNGVYMVAEKGADLIKEDHGELYGA